MPVQNNNVPLVFALDLSVARAAVQIVAPGVAYSQISVRRLTAGAVMQLRAGLGGPDVSFNQQDLQTFPVPNQLGLYLTNAAQAGAIAEVYVARASI